MIEKKLIEMNDHELREVVGIYREKARKAETMGIINEYEVWMRKALIAESYMIDINKVEIGKVYQLIGNQKEYFKVERIKGVFAWGFRLGAQLEEEGIPLALLQLDA
ncbi:YfhH family protein [Macrococcoides caseolyticum]|uniref:YfhH family protein n=1 Tax=Macrococcoides caseolyticum TaxID=69966 RepID=UPI001F189EBB|nr:YfhH family protein [Macrococcus caseolyticus]MCE4957519.1 YfhH family protein [Macrococcus caseolyticus]